MSGNQDTGRPTAPDSNAAKPMQSVVSNMQSWMNNGQNGMNGDQSGMKSGQSGMKEKQSGMNSGQSGVNGDQSWMDNGQEGMNSGQSGVNGGQNGVNFGQRGTNGGQSGVNGGQSGMDNGQSGMDNGQNGMKNGQNGMKNGQNGMKDGQNGMKSGQNEKKYEQCGMNGGQNGVNSGQRGTNGDQNWMKSGQRGTNGSQSGVNCGQSGMKSGQSGMNNGQNGMYNGQKGMNDDQNGINSGQSWMNSGQSGMNVNQRGMNSDQSGMSSGQNGMNDGQNGINSGQSLIKSGQGWASSFFNLGTGTQSKNDEIRKGGDVSISPNEKFCNQLLDTISNLEKEKTRLAEENNVLWNQSAEVFKQNRDKRLELVNDPYPLGTIVDDMRHLFTTDWCDIWEEGEDDCSTIHQISDMLEVINKNCSQMANQQIRSLLCLDVKNGPVPTRQEKPDIYRLRRKEGIDPDVRERVTTRIVSELLDGSSHPNMNTTAERSEEKAEARNFYEKFADCCWLLAIAEECVIVDFNVIGKDYDNIKHRFNKYMTKHTVTGTNLNSVKTLVWPCIVKEDGTLLEKGHVIAVENIETKC